MRRSIALAWGNRFERLRHHISSCLASLVFHAALVIVLGLLARTSLSGSGVVAIQARTLEATDESQPILEELRGQRASSAEVSIAGAGSAIAPGPGVVAPELSIGGSQVEAQARPLASLRWPSVEEGRDLLYALDAEVAGALDGRRLEIRDKLALEGGGSKESQDAVQRGLRWLQVHQRLDGSWHFDHTTGPCGGLCRHPGDVGSTTAATGMALLAFLGAGQTHLEGDYTETVRMGLYHLTGQMLITPQGGDLQEGTMYAQGLATIALCEAYAMTHDQTLEDYAQRAIDFIVNAQHKEGGGWRYFPGQPGDTTVTGWQLMALKSGQMAYLRVPPQTIFDVTRFLDSVQADDGARYGYLSPDTKPTTTSIGLLCRMYTGWPRENAALARGVKFLSGQGPSRDNMYYNYYGTQVMHHWGGEEWRLWNYILRDYLIETQASQGHESGSWFFSGGQGAKGGRLYNTAMAVMTLEVYYRHLPLYGASALVDY